MPNDIDIIVGVKDLATVALDRISKNVTTIATSSQNATIGLARPLQANLEKLSEQLAARNAGGNNAGMSKALEAAITSASAKIDAAVAKTNGAIDTVANRVQSGISKITAFISSAAKVATVGAAFFTVGRAVYGMSNNLGLVPSRLDQITQRAEQTGRGVLGVVSQFGKYTIAAGATVALTRATMQATSATTSLLGRVSAIAQGGVAAFVLRNALKKTEDGTSTLTAKLAKVAGTGLAFAVVTKTVVGCGLSLVGLRRNADDANATLLKTSLAAQSLGAVKTGASAATVAAAGLASKIDELPRGAQSVNTVVASFGNFAATLGGIPGLLLAIPAGIAGIGLAAVTATGKTERQITQLTNKLAIVEAAKLNVNIEDINTAPLRKVSEESARVSKQIQTATNVQASKLVSLATSALPKGLDSAQIADSMKAAVGLSEVYGTSIEDGMYRVRQAIDGNFESFEKLIPSIKTMATNEEKIAAVSRLAANGFKVMHSETLTFWGTVERTKNGLGNLLESLGRMESTSDVVGTVLRDVVTPAVEFLDSKLKGFGFNGNAVLDQAIAIGAGFVATIQTIGTNWDSLTDRLMTGAELFWVQLQSHAENFATNTMPWLSENMVGIFQNAWSAIVGDTKTQFDIMVASAMEAMGAVPAGTADFMREEAARKPKNTVPLTAMKEREKGPREAELEQRLADIDSKIGASIKDNYEKAFASLDQMVNEQRLGLDPKIDLKPAVPEPKKEEAKADLKPLTAQSANVQALQSRFLSRGAIADPQTAAIKESNKLLAQQVKLLEKQMAMKESEARNDKPALQLEIVG